MKPEDLLDKDLNLLADFLVMSFFSCLDRGTPPGEAAVEANEMQGAVEGMGAMLVGAQKEAVCP